VNQLKTTIILAILLIIGIALSGCIEKIEEQGIKPGNEQLSPLRAPPTTVEQGRDILIFEQAMEEQNSSLCETITDQTMTELCKEVTPPISN